MELPEKMIFDVGEFVGIRTIARESVGVIIGRVPLEVIMLYDVWDLVLDRQWRLMTHELRKI